MKHLLTVFLAIRMFDSVVIASPVAVHLDSGEKVERIGAIVNCHDHYATKNPTDLLTFEIEWDPTFETTDDHYARLDFIVWQEGPGREHQILIRYQKREDETITADISLLRRDLDRAILLFRGSDSFEYFLPLSLVVADYPGSENSGEYWDFEPLKGEPGAAGQPAPRLKSK